MEMSDSHIDTSGLYEFLRVRPAVDRRVALLEALNNPDVNGNVFALSGMIGVPVDHIRRDVSDLVQLVDGIEYEGDAVTITAPDQHSLIAEKVSGFL